MVYLPAQEAWVGSEQEGSPVKPGLWKDDQKEIAHAGEGRFHSIPDYLHFYSLNNPKPHPEENPVASGFGTHSLLQQLQIYLGDYVFLELILESVGIPQAHAN